MASYRCLLPCLETTVKASSFARAVLILRVQRLPYSLIHGADNADSWGDAMDFFDFYYPW
jgi:hypothetical protein